MSTEITQQQLRNDSGDIMRGLDRGQTYVVTRNGVPVGDLFAGAPDIDFERFRADLDRVASQELGPRA